MTIQPIDDRIVLKRVEAVTTTAGGIVLPDSAKEKPQKGEIVAAGPGVLLDSGKRAPMDVKVGDIVIFGKYAGTEVRVDGQDLIIMKESDILAIEK